jgi:hypothetical protein
MFLLDTNVFSEMRKAGDGKADARVIAWLSGVDAANFYISVITLMEIELGILRVERRDHLQGKRLRKWIHTRVIPEFSGRILPIDEGVALRCARLHVPDPQSERDAYIAATALVHGMTIVTRNQADFETAGVRICNPWGATA